MTPASLARRYATALFDVVRVKGDLERAGEELSAFGALIEAHPDLRKVFETPAVPAARKREIVQAVLTHAGGVGPEVSRLLLLLADRNRLALIPAVAAAFEDRRLAARQIVPAEIVTAEPLGDDGRAGLARALGHAAGGEVRLSERVDPSIIGGLVARVGGIVFDGSLTRQLERMRQQLLASSS